MLKNKILSIFLLFSCIIQAHTKASEFHEETLLSNQETWQVQVPDEEKNFTKVTISFIRTSFYDEDIKKERFFNIEKGTVLLRGFRISNNVDNKSIGKECPHPKVNIEPIEGVKDPHGRIILYSVKTTPLFSGSGNYN